MEEMIQSNNTQELLSNLSSLIAGQYTEFREKEFYITNRTVFGNFPKVFKDSVGSYIENVFLVERFFNPEHCEDSTRSYYDVSEEQQKIYDEFLAFVNNKDLVDQLSPEDHQIKLAEYEEKLSLAKPIIKDVPVKIYNLHEQDQIILNELKGIPDDLIVDISTKNAAAIIGIFHSMNYLSYHNYKIDVMPIHYPNYVDIVARISIVTE